MKSIALALLAATALSMFDAAPAQAITCNEYANQMVFMDGLARKRRCAGWTSSSDRKGHAAWCNKNPVKADVALNSWSNRFNNCLSKNSVR